LPYGWYCPKQKPETRNHKPETTNPEPWTL